MKRPGVLKEIVRLQVDRDLVPEALGRERRHFGSRREPASIAGGM
jgi:hypothetical protein